MTAHLLVSDGENQDNSYDDNNMVESKANDANDIKRSERVFKSFLVGINILLFR